jgi:hypothetical protein
MMLRAYFNCSSDGFCFIILYFTLIPLAGLILGYGIYHKQVSYNLFALLSFILFGLWNISEYYSKYKISTEENITVDYLNPLIVGVLFFMVVPIILFNLILITMNKKNEIKTGFNRWKLNIITALIGLGLLFGLVPSMINLIRYNFNYKSFTEKNYKSSNLTTANRSVENLINQFKINGYNIKISGYSESEEDGSVEYGYTTVENIQTKKNFKFIDFYSYNTKDKLDQVVTQIKSSGYFSSPYGRPQGIQNYYRTEQVLVLYKGNDSDIMNILRSILGEKVAEIGISTSTLID